MKLLILFLIATSMNFASGRTIYGQDGVQVVKPGNKNMSEQVEKLASGVCSIGKNGKASECCSGFLVAPDLVLTNFHCLTCLNKSVKGQPDPFVTLIGSFFGRLFGKEPQDSEYDSLIKEKGVVRTLNENYSKDFTGINLHHIEGSRKSKILKITELVDANEALDFSLVRIERKIEETENHHIFSLSNRPVELDTRLINIGHPGKSPAPGYKVFDDTDECRVSSLIAPLGIKKEVFAHKCDTNGGSSGSPMIEKETGRVVGLHFAGGAKNEKEEGFNLTFNRAVKMEKILEYLKVNQPDAYSELTVW
ncbi:MAG: trypsin-like serine peptidase [Bacteriovoracia bacterium]